MLPVYVDTIELVSKLRYVRLWMIGQTDEFPDREAEEALDTITEVMRTLEEAET